ncbi:hypothetical protein EJB05_32014 [Eragrostis curvula]|uniref:rRNA N-glycosidase n=1 Tax=Eragrostis curvula TaxID=38414 RepID=A0A5J9UGM4_9POAL|nr:hypothetical protein EJB05_56528 [Eragrostis curvula]TVU22328.1 hypothetical protein EJB05_32014 [Eragrostis curvula]
MAYQHISDEKIDSELKGLLQTDREKNICEKNIFEKWSPMMKRKFYEDLQISLPNPEEVCDLDAFKRKIFKLGPKDAIDVMDSCIFDTTHLHRIQDLYIVAISRYQAWQLAGTDKIHMFGSSDKTVFVTRGEGIFVFWVRYKHDDVGMVIDGQTGWVEGFITRVLNDDGSFTYGAAFQFKRDSNETEKGSSKDNSYIMTKNLAVIKGGGNYSRPVQEINLDPSDLQMAVYLLRNCNPNTHFDKNHRKACDILLLFGPEAAKNRAILQYTYDSLKVNSERRMIPAPLDATVIKYDKSSQSANDCLSGMGYKTVVGSPIRSLVQCIEIHPFIKRRTCFDTKFYLEDSQASYLKQKQAKKSSKVKETEEQRKDRERERRLKQGILFNDVRHSGLYPFKGLEIIYPPKPSELTKWYNY